MHRFFKEVAGIAAMALLSVAFVAAPVPQSRAQEQQKKVKDQGEYDLFQGVTKEADANKRLSLLNTWRDKYPNTDFKLERLVYFLTTYQALGQPAKILDTAKEILAMDPKNIQALFFVTSLTPQMNSTNAEALDAGEKAANGLLGAEKPANTKDEDWKKAKSDLDAMGHKTLGWIAMQRKNNDLAEQEFKKSLEINNNAGEVSYWLGTVILAQKRPERYSEVLWDFARAASLDQAHGGLNPQGRASVDAYLTKAYNNFHGQDDAGLKQLKQQAAAQSLPPADFKIKNVNEIAAEKEEEFKKSNPQLALWMGLKKELTGPNGEQYFESSMKGAAVPKLKGYVVAGKPAVRSKELVLGLADPKVPEVTLKLDTALTGKPEIGNEIEFEGVPASYTKEPFMVTFDVEKAKITGLKVEAAAPVRRPVPKKKKD